MSRLDYVPLGSLMKKVAGVIPSGVLAADAVSNTCTNYHSGGRTAVEYHSGGWVSNTSGNQSANGRLSGTLNPYGSGEFPFNIQGQKWFRDVRPSFSGPEQYGGVRNCATPRRISAPGLGIENEIFPHIIEFEFLFTGIEFSLVHMNLGGNNTGGNWGGHTEIYIEHDGELFMAADTPKVTTRTDGPHSYRNVAFNEWQTDTLIRIVMGTATFTAIRTDARSILRPSPTRHIVGFDGDSYTESSQALCTDNSTQFFTNTWANFLFRETQFSWPQFGQGATGFNSNGATQVFDDTVGTQQQMFFMFEVTVTGLSRYFSGNGAGVSSRKNWYTNAWSAMAAMGKTGGFVNYAGDYFGGPLGLRPLAHLHVGTWNDISSGAGNPVTDAQMYERVAHCYDWVHTVDPHCKFIHVSPEPFNDGLFAGNTGVGILGGPRRGATGDIHTRAQMRAASERDWVHYVNAYGPAEPWWTGMGPALSTSGGVMNVPANSQQAQLVSTTDSIHGKLEMHRYLAGRLRDAISDIPVLVERVQGLI